MVEKTINLKKKRENNFSLKIKNEIINIRKIYDDPVLMITIIFSLLVVGFFILLPLFNILKSSLLQNGKLTLYHYKDVLNQANSLQVIWNTVKLGMVTGTLATGIGFLFAYVITYIDVPGKKIFDSIAILPIISPPFVIALSAILLFGRIGLITHGIFGIENEIYGFTGLVLVQTLTFFPVAYLMLVGLLEKIDPSVEEAARDLGASRWQVFKTITLPLMVPGLANAFLIVFIQAIADFGNPMVIGGNYTTAAVQIYLQGIGSFDMGAATALSIILLSLSVGIFAFQKYYISKRSYVTVTGKVSKAREKITGKKITYSMTAILFIITLIVGMMYALIPIVAFVKLWGVNYSLSLSHFKYVFALGLKPILDTTYLALIATPITGIIAMIIGFLIVRKKFIGKNFIEFMTMVALAIPGTIIGLGYVITYNKKPLVLTGTAMIILIAFIIRNMPVGIRSAIAALQQIDPSIEEAASVLGANSHKVFTSITLPMIKPAFFSGLIYAFVRSMTLISTIIFLISARYNLLTPAIMSQIDLGRLGVASAYCTILVIIVSVFIMIMKLLFKKIGIDEISEV
ncbi:ABC transporter permease [Haliovirga abyssi]|uniref:Iron ABC transporter permease n=1 Tax=Haliovirga abyssi TaxID=2996794 RepID=A0AAU9D6M8_9FUSO|nr:iron ABC transporter permease [Haliovirga abyssi]BDU51634.1 iron ABC transporter permease [Haliovirga abyssi]